jgi:hypothetical protein
MKIYRKLVLRIADHKVIESDDYEYIGPILNLKGGGGGTTTTEPWAGQQPYQLDIYGQAQNASQQPTQYYPGETVAGFTPAQTAAQTATVNRAVQGNPLMGQAQGVMSDTLSGSFMNPDSNPWLSATYNKAAGAATQKFGESVMPEIRRTAIGEGAYGGGRQGVAEGIAGRGLADSLAGMATDIYGQNYQTERGRQDAAVMNSIPMAASDYTDIGKLAAVGEEQQSMDQTKIDAAQKAWEFYQNEPWNRLGNYSNLITGDVGGTTASSGGGK